MLRTMKKNVNERVKLLRTSVRLTQVEFANEIGFSPSSVAKIESGEKPSEDILHAIIEKFQVPEKWLVEGIGEMTYVKPEKDQFDPARDTLYKELKEQIEFLKEIIRAKPNFRLALNHTGLSKERRLRVKAA